MLPHRLTNFETEKYYQNKPKLNGVSSRNNLLKIKDGEYFDSFGVEHIPKEIKKNGRHQKYYNKYL